MSESPALRTQGSSAFIHKPGKLRELSLNWALLRFRFGLDDMGHVRSPSDFGELQPSALENLRIHFWVPAKTPGARIAVLNMLDALCVECERRRLPWKISCGRDLPSQPVDIIVCYKAVPPAGSVSGKPQRVLLFCDQLECFWVELGAFNAVVIHSSRELAGLVARRHPQSWFIEECEESAEVEEGEINLVKSPPSTRSPLIVWHGHRHSLEGLQALRPMLEQFARSREVNLRLISNHESGREDWGMLSVERVSYTDNSFADQVAEARLGLVPTRNVRMKHCLFKPSSRMRRLFALGVPALGQHRCVMVREFAGCLTSPQPVADSPDQWGELLRHYWDNPVALDALARVGHTQVREHYAMPQYARKWVQFLAQMASKQPYLV